MLQLLSPKGKMYGTVFMFPPWKDSNSSKYVPWCDAASLLHNQLELCLLAVSLISSDSAWIGLLRACQSPVSSITARLDLTLQIKCLQKHHVTNLQSRQAKAFKVGKALSWGQLAALQIWGRRMFRWPGSDKTSAGLSRTIKLKRIRGSGLTKGIPDTFKTIQRFTAVPRISCIQDLANCQGISIAFASFRKHPLVAWHWHSWAGAQENHPLHARHAPLARPSCSPWPRKLAWKRLEVAEVHVHCFRFNIRII